MNMKGQYFSFDAIVAAIIVVLAFSLFASYWFSMQSITDSRVTDMRQDAMRVSEALLSPGTPGNWASLPPDKVSQAGIANGFGLELNTTKIIALQNIGNTNPPQQGAARLRNLFSVPGNIYVTIIRADSNIGPPASTIGMAPPAVTNESASAYRGATLDGHPMQMRVVIYR